MPRSSCASTRCRSISARRDPAVLDTALDGLVGDEGHDPDQMLGAYATTLAPAVISADSPLSSASFRPRRPRRHSFSTCSSRAPRSTASAGLRPPVRSTQKIRCSPARGPRGLPESAGGCFVSGGSAANLSALAVGARNGQASRKPAVNPTVPVAASATRVATAGQRRRARIGIEHPAPARVDPLSSHRRSPADRRGRSCGRRSRSRPRVDRRRRRDGRDHERWHHR